MSHLFYFFISCHFSLFCSVFSPSLCHLKSEDVKNLQCFSTKKKYGYMQSIMAEICITWVGFSCSSVPSLFEMLVVVVLVPTGALSAAMKMNKLYEQLYKYLKIILFTKRMWTMCNVMSESIHVSFPFDCAMSWMMPTCSHVHTAHRIRQHKAKDESH